MTEARKRRTEDLCNDRREKRTLQEHRLSTTIRRSLSAGRDVRTIVKCEKPLYWTSFSQNGRWKKKINRNSRRKAHMHFLQPIIPYPCNIKTATAFTEENRKRYRYVGHNYMDILTEILCVLMIHVVTNGGPISKWINHAHAMVPTLNMYTFDHTRWCRWIPWFDAQIGLGNRTLHLCSAQRHQQSLGYRRQPAQPWHLQAPQRFLRLSQIPPHFSECESRETAPDHVLPNWHGTVYAVTHGYAR